MSSKRLGTGPNHHHRLRADIHEPEERQARQLHEAERELAKTRARLLAIEATLRTVAVLAKPYVPDTAATRSRPSASGWRTQSIDRATKK